MTLALAATASAGDTDATFLFRAHGQELPSERYIFALDADGRPVRSSVTVLDPGLFRLETDARAARLSLLWEIPGAGRLMTDVDLAPTPAGDSPPVNLNLAIAETEVATVVKEYERGLFDQADASAARVAADLARLAGAPNLDPPTLAARADALTFRAESLLDAAARGRALLDISTHRKADVEISVVDESGRPAAGATVTCRQTSSDFLFGSHPTPSDPQNPDEPSPLLRAGGPVFNCGLIIPATRLRGGVDGCPFTTEELHALWSRTDKAVAMQTGLGHPPQCNVDLWLTDSIGPWLAEMAFPEQCRFVSDTIQEAVAHFADRLDVYLVANELHDWANSLDLSRDELVEITRAACEGARQGDPEGRTIVNACLPWGGYLHWFGDTSLLTPYDYFAALIDAGVDFDIVGLQTYMCVSVEFPARSLYDMSLLLDRYAELGKPIWITEFCCPSEGSTWGAYGGEEWTEESQAEYAYWYYTIAMSKPQVESIRWFGLSDGSFPVASGLLRRGGAPKPAYEALARLRTEVETHSDRTGVVTFRGLLGDYEAEARTAGGRSASAAFRLERGPGPTRIVLTIE